MRLYSLDPVSDRRIRYRRLLRCLVMEFYQLRCRHAALRWGSRQYCQPYGQGRRTL